ncbi:hypothetical protein BOVATA_047090 [Babesia ovata]|uniref:Uncharacterized protein n=1 Tax=Babesia ovata TaxID=189622 RepID=A0A2H6KJP8_9APIC|nr:uncharacterized protein BOVATA_047090 [Babesia ovata]GBE63216.1 hypothetical protein BOVATA_047090 [Babesia ovata]
MRIWAKDADGGGDEGVKEEGAKRPVKEEVGRFGGVWGKAILGEGGREGVREAGGQGEGGEEAKEGDEGRRWDEVRRFGRWRGKVENEDLGEGRRRRR